MKKEWFVPAAIVFAGVVVAVSIYTTRHHDATQQGPNLAAMRPVSLTDHVIGNPGASVVLVEYSDSDSEYSKDFEQTMEQVMQKYAAGGQVAWVYRDFPLITNDTNSEQNAEAAECANGLAGNQAFFSFIDAMQAAAPGDAQFDPLTTNGTATQSGYDTIASSLGISTGDFDACLAAHTYESRVQADYNNAMAIGATGSPYNILLVRGQKPVLISGAIPYSAMTQIIDASIAKVLAQPSTN